MLEDFFQFGKYNPSLGYQKDSIGEKLLRPYTRYGNKLIHILNARSARTTLNLPDTRSDLPVASQNEAVHCSHCDTYIPIRRTYPKITVGLSTKYSNYITRPMEYCSCKDLAVLVDHRGNLRVYGNALYISLVNYLVDFPIYHLLSNQEHAPIPNRLLDGIKPKYEYLTKPRYLWESNFIDLTYLNSWERQIVLPVPKGKTMRQIRDYYQQYAHNHQVLILLNQYTILPSGICINNKVLPKQIVEEMGILRTNKTSYQYLDNCNTYAINLVNRLEDLYQLPKASPKLHPWQTIGYLQIIKDLPPKPIYRGTKIYISGDEARQISTMRNAAIQMLRDRVNGQEPYPKYTRDFDRPIPILSLIYSARLLYTPPKPKQCLRQAARIHRLYEYTPSTQIRYLSILHGKA